MLYSAGPLSIEGQVRALLAHEASGYEEWGASAAVRLDPSGSGRGLTLSIAPTWGSPQSTSEMLWSMDNAGELAPDDDFEAGRALDAEIGYGLGLSARRGLLTPYAGISFGDGGRRSWRTGARWTITAEIDVQLEGTRTSANEGVRDQALMLRAGARW